MLESVVVLHGHVISSILVYVRYLLYIISEFEPVEVTAC
jgi:hypothetical protein